MLTRGQGSVTYGSHFYTKEIFFFSWIVHAKLISNFSHSGSGPTSPVSLWFIVIFYYNIKKSNLWTSSKETVWGELFIGDHWNVTDGEKCNNRWWKIWHKNPKVHMNSEKCLSQTKQSIMRGKYC